MCGVDRFVEAVGVCLPGVPFAWRGLESTGGRDPCWQCTCCVVVCLGSNIVVNHSLTLSARGCVYLLGLRWGGWMCSCCAPRCRRCVLSMAAFCGLWMVGGRDSWVLRPWCRRGEWGCACKSRVFGCAVVRSCVAEWRARGGRYVWGSAWGG